MGRAGTTRNELGLPETSWNNLEPRGTRLTQQRTDTEKQKLIGRNCMCNIIAQYNTTLAVVIVTKSAISPREEWNP